MAEASDGSRAADPHEAEDEGPLARFAPGLATLTHYRRPWLRGDVFAGITVLAYLVPQVLAYAGLIGLPPVAGLVTALAALVVYAVLGSSRIISVGPEATVALMTGLIIMPMVAGDPGRALGLTATLTLLVAAWLGLAAALRLGVISAVLSKPILIGYLTGSAILMVSSQLGKATRTSSSGDTVIAQFQDFFAHAADTHGPTLLITLGTLVFLFAVPRISSKLPVALGAIALATIVSYAASLEQYGVVTLGPIPQGLPAPTLPDLTWATVSSLALGALGIAIVVFSDVMITARAFNPRGASLDPNAELRAMSGVHAAASLLGGYPSSASTSRTSIGQAAGAVTQMHGLIAAVGVGLTLLVAGPLFESLPQAALAAVVIWAATKLVALRDYRHMWSFRRSEYLVAGVTALATATMGILPGIGVAVGISVVEMLVRLARPHEATQGYVPGLAGLHDVDDYPGAVTVPGLLIYRYDAPLFFGNCEDFKERLQEAIDTNPTEPNWVILNVEANMHIDYTATEALRDMIIEVEESGGRLGLARLKQDLRSQLQAAGIMDLIGEDLVFSTLPEAIRAYAKHFPDVDTPRMPKTGKPFEEPEPPKERKRASRRGRRR